MGTSMGRRWGRNGSMKTCAGRRLGGKCRPAWVGGDWEWATRRRAQATSVGGGCGETRARADSSRSTGNKRTLCLAGRPHEQWPEPARLLVPPSWQTWARHTRHTRETRLPHSRPEERVPPASSTPGGFRLAMLPTYTGENRDRRRTCRLPVIVPAPPKPGTRACGMTDPTCMSQPQAASKKVAVSPCSRRTQGKIATIAVRVARPYTMSPATAFDVDAASNRAAVAEGVRGNGPLTPTYPCS